MKGLSKLDHLLWIIKRTLHSCYLFYFFISAFCAQRLEQTAFFDDILPVSSEIWHSAANRNIYF